MIESIAVIWVDYIRWNLVWVWIVGLLVISGCNRDRWLALREACGRRKLHDHLAPSSKGSLAVVAAKLRVLLPEIVWLLGFGLVVTVLDVILVGL